MGDFSVMSGLGLLLVGVAAWLIYLRRPQAMLLDAVSMGWLGFIIWIALSVLLLGYLEPNRKYRGGSQQVVALIGLGLVGYLIGLAWKPAHRAISRVIPTPRDTLTIPSVWCILLISFVVSVATILYATRHHYMGPSERRMVGACLSTGFGSAGVLAILLITAYRHAWGSKVAGICVLAVVMLLLYFFSFSRRPIPGLVGALIAMFYHFRIRHRPFGVRALFLGGAAVSLMLVVLLLTATRSQRFGEGRAQGLFSRQVQHSLFGGMTVNIHALEFSVLRYPDQFSYLYGSGIAPLFVWPIPRSIWPGKPIPTGGVISYQYTHSHNWSVGNTLLGEAFMNFGWVGTPIFMILMGAIVGGINRKLHNEQYNVTAWVAWFAIVPDFISEWRGDLNAMTVQPFLRVALFLLMAWLLGQLFPQARRLQASDLRYGLPEDEAAPQNTAPPVGNPLPDCGGAALSGSAVQ